MVFNIMVQVPNPDSMMFYGLKWSEIPFKLPSLKLTAAPENKPKKLPQKGS